MYSRQGGEETGEVAVAAFWRGIRSSTWPETLGFEMASLVRMAMQKRNEEWRDFAFDVAALPVLRAMYLAIRLV